MYIIIISMEILLTRRPQMCKTVIVGTNSNKTRGNCLTSPFRYFQVTCIKCNFKYSVDNKQATV